MYAVRWSCIYKRFQFEQDVVMVLVYWHRGGHLSYLSPLIKAGNAGVFLIIFSLSRDPTGRARLLIILPASLLSKARQKVPASPCPSCVVRTHMSV